MEKIGVRGAAVFGQTHLLTGTRIEWDKNGEKA
jgi:hypothetical protein